jgi:urea transporter
MDVINILLKGFSQVFFQENILMGVLIVVAIGIASPLALILSIIGCITATVVTNLLITNKILYEVGLFGFNGVLIGCATAFYLKSMPLSIIVVIIGSVISAGIYSLLIKNNIPPLAFPFAITTVLVIIAIKTFHLS